MKINKHVELWPDQTSGGRYDSPWIVSIETDYTSTTKYTDYDYDVAEGLAVHLATELDLKLVIRNRLGEVKVIDPVAENR